MTKEVMQQALEALESDNPYLGYLAAHVIRNALAQPVQEQQQARVDVITVTLMREGINKHKARELASHFVNFTLALPQPVQEAVAWRFQDPKDGHWLYTTHVVDLSKKYWRLKNEVFEPLYTAPPLPEQEPVACRFCHSKKGCWAWQCDSCGEIDDVQQPTPPAAQRPWVGLTDAEIEIIYAKCNVWDKFEYERMLEAKLKEKTNG